MMTGAMSRAFGKVNCTSAEDATEISPDGSRELQLEDLEYYESSDLQMCMIRFSCQQQAFGICKPTPHASEQFPARPLHIAFAFEQRHRHDFFKLSNMPLSPQNHTLVTLCSFFL